MDSSKGLVWHYTDASGFVNIIRSGELWATQMSGLNDASELLYGCEQVVSACKAAARNRDVPDDDRRWLDVVETWLIAEQARDQIFVASASLAGDSLNQWMHYGSGGYAIGLDPDSELGYLSSGERVERREPGLTHATCWTDVRYGEDKELVGQAIEAILAARESETNDWNQWRQLTLLRTLAASQKHLGFRDERETRYLVPVPLDCDARQYRVSRSGAIASYVRLVGFQEKPGSERAKAELPIEAVRIGPPLGRGDEIGTVQRFLADAGYTDIDISTSDIPYSP